MKQILTETQTTGEVFDSRTPFMVFLDTYTDGWFLQYAANKENAANINWKNWHEVSLREHGDLSYAVVYGSRWQITPDLVFRMHGGTVGATAFISYLDLSIFT